MAYTSLNRLKRVRKVNIIYQHYKSKGCTNEYIFTEYIEERFHISRKTFYTYLTIPYEKEMRKLGYDPTNNDKPHL